ncbi:MAG: LPS-assembly protein LptD [Pseudomonadota bacterium]|jgi:LPS-assembly protein
MPFSLRGRLGPLVLCCVSGSVLAAENLPPLRVDPALLDQGRAPAPPVAEQPAAPAPETAAQPMAEVPPVQRVDVPAAPAAPATPRRAPRERTPAVVSGAGPREQQAAAGGAETRAAPAPGQPAPAGAAGSGLALPAAPRRETRRDATPTMPSAQIPPAAPPRGETALAPPAAPPTASLDILPPEDERVPPPALRLSETLSPLPRDPQQEPPTFVIADRISGRTDDVTRAEGAAELRKGNTVVTAERMTHWAVEDEVDAEGNVHVRQGADVMAGPKLRLKLTDNVGVFEQPKYSITRPAHLLPQTSATLPVSAWETPAPAAAGPRPGEVIAGEVVGDPRLLVTASGSAERLEFLGEGLYRLGNATYSTCKAEDPDWYAAASELDLDYNREVGEARQARVVFKDVPILYSPWLEFSLNNRRKSGFLTPTYGSTTTTGPEVTLPYYWNIAPNMDATIAPRFMGRRGLQLNTEYRYLNYTHTGQARVEWLPKDGLKDGEQRWGYSLQHSHNLGYGFAGTLNLNRVSDGAYFRDLSTRISNTSQSLLLNQGVLTYGAGWWSATASVQRYQLLADPAQPALEKPYERVPQMTLTAIRPDVFGTSLNFNGEFVAFDHPTKVEARRLIAYPQLALPWQTPAFYVTPKIGYHVTRYDLLRQDPGVPDRLTRSLPIFSVDSGVTFERDLTLAGRPAIQTLEPRLYYLYVPYRRQDRIPVFDTGVADLNFATLFAENVFVGGDRIADANQLTAALASRLIDPASGREVMRGAVGQRFYFKDQEVTLPGVPARTRRRADILVALSGEVLPRAFVDAGWQYNPSEGFTERLNVGGRYQPEPLKVLNVVYRYTRDVLGQIDVSGQWPVGRGWYGVGRYNYSLKESRAVETIGGLEYDGGCWAARFVVQRIATTPTQATTALFLQLELNGLARLGSNPLDLLKRNIPGYGIINQPTADPAFAAR